MDMRFLPDTPILSESEDCFGFNSFAGLIASSIANTQTPFVYGILGDWGSGKTSVLNLLRRKLEAGPSHLVPIWFNAWKYENEENVIYPLLFAIKAHYEANKNVKREDGKFFNSLLKTVTASAFVATDLGLRIVTKASLGEAIKLEDVAKQLKMVEDHAEELNLACSTWADQITKLERRFENLLKQYANDRASFDNNIDKDEVRFIVFVDDLDRCLPDIAIRVLESIKNFLSVKRSIFVLGLNPYVVHEGIRIKYKGLKIDGRRYLEKILNYSFHVPEPQVTDVQRFASAKLEMLVLHENDRRKFKSHFDEFGLVLSECNFTNPRKIKRILNRYLFFLSKYDSQLRKFNNQNIVRLLILAEYYPSLFSLYLEDSSGAKELLNLGTSDFDVHEFESKYNVTISADHGDLLRMRKLFAMKLVGSDNFPLVMHAKAVRSITSIG